MIRRKLGGMLTSLILPLACVWIERQERRILEEGVPLDTAQFADARALGVAEPARIRLLCVPQVPLPGNRLTCKLGLLTGLLSTETVGMSARHGIYLRQSHRGERRLLAHELVHTRQYEQLGGIRPFLRRYLSECLTVGYLRADLEQEAREAASALCG